MEENKMEELLNILNEMHPDVDFATEEHLIDNMILDSLDIVSLIAEINDVFDVTITARDIVPANFNSAKALYALIEKLDGEA
jgi:D-alanine--poly(phosphoribitol) ligase subunit 2